MTEKKEATELTMGPTGTWVADAIREYRQKRQLSFAEMEQRLNDVGHRIHALGLRRIEARTRRVDVDDVMAIAVVLNVSPMRLLLHIPDVGQGQPFQVATGLPGDVPWSEAAAWARGETGLSREERIEFWRREVRVIERIVAENTEQVKELTQELQLQPDDSRLLDRHHWAVGLEDRSVRNHAEAVEMLASLESQRGSEM